nr:MAG TPA: hypothetical protein [Caudoviricetes sp.]
METNVITTVFNAQEALPINDEARITKAQILFLYAAANAAADRPSIICVDEGPLPFTDVAEAAPRYGEIRQWLGTFLDNNLVFRAMMPIDDNATVVSEIKRLSHECTDAGLLEFCVDDDTLRFTALGVEAIEKYGPVLDEEWRLIERTVLEIVNERYGHCGIGVEKIARHVPTTNPRELKDQFVLVDQDLMAATYRRTDGMLLANVFGVGTFIVEKLCAINASLLATLADEGHLQRDPEDTLSEYHDRFQAMSKEYQRQHGIPDDEEEDAAVPTDAPMANLAAALGKMLGSRVGLSRIDIPAGGGKADVVDLNDKVQDAEVVLDAEKKPVS